MAFSSAIRIRFAIVGIFSVLAVGFLLSPGNAQFGRPPTFPKPPAFQPPTFPKPPTFPQTPTIPPIRPPTMPSMPSVPSMPGIGRDEWRCSGCRYLVGTGPIKPAVSQCPGCGARFTNAGIGAPNFSLPPIQPNIPSNPPIQPASPNNPPNRPNTPNKTEPEVPPLPVNPAAGGNWMQVLDSPARENAPTGMAPPTAGESSAPSDTNPPAPGRGGRRMFIAFAIGIGVILLLGFAALGFVVLKAAKPVKRVSSRKRLELDDD